MSRMKKFYRRVLLGLGFDCENGHIRITKGENFRLFGGSEQTHELLQEKAIKFNEQLDKCGKTLDDISRQEFYDIANKIGLEISEDQEGQNKESEEV